MTITLNRPTTLFAALAASALSFTLALAPMTARAATPLDTAIAACGAAWTAQSATAGVQDVRMDRLDDAGNKIKLTLRGRDSAGAKITTRCVVNSKGQVLSLGDQPVTQLASGGTR